MLWRKLTPVLVLGALLVAYVLARPALAENVEHLGIIEYPVGLLLTALLVWLALRRPREERAPEPPLWRRHEQVVRPLPDPEVARLEAPLRAWVEKGESPEAAAAVLARARARDPAEADALALTLAAEMSSASNARARRKLLDSLTSNVNPGA